MKNAASEGVREYPAHILPHAAFGSPKCPGLLFPNEAGEAAVCNECGTTVQPSKDMADAFRTADTVTCPHCKAKNLIPGFSRVLSFTCRECGKPVELAAD